MPAESPRAPRSPRCRCRREIPAQSPAEPGMARRGRFQRLFGRSESEDSEPEAAAAAAAPRRRPSAAPAAPKRRPAFPHWRPKKKEQHPRESARSPQPAPHPECPAPRYYDVSGRRCTAQENQTPSVICPHSYALPAISMSTASLPAALRKMLLYL
ncbi:uncharacterized protein VK521_000720 [Ammospiza maritima maritima]